MATSQVSLLAYLGNDADFRSWGSGLAAQFAAVGLVQTADTGQINWTTVTRPSTSSYGGYEIWRFPSGTEQTACPIFLKIEYGIGTAADRPALRVQAASGTNGAGTLTGQIQSGALTLAAGGSKTSTTTLPSYVSGGNNWLHVVTNHDNASQTFGIRLIVERPANGDGTPTTSGFWLLAGASSSGINHAAIPATGTVATNNTTSPFSTSGGQVTTVGTDVAMWDAPIMLGRSYTTRLLAYKHADIGELTPITASHHDASHTYMPIGDGWTTIASTSSDAAAILWE